MDRSDSQGCDFSVMQLDVPPPQGPLFIFGDPFLRRFVTIYDRSGPSVGFAVAKRDGMDAGEASRIISKAEGGGEMSSTGASPTASMDAAMNGGGSPAASSGSSPVSVSLDAGMMTGDSSGDDDQPAPHSSYDDHTDDATTTTTTTAAADVPDHFPGSQAENAVAADSSSASENSGTSVTSASSSSDVLANFFKSDDVKPTEATSSPDESTVKAQDSFGGYDTWKSVDSSSTTMENTQASQSGSDSPKPEKSESAVERMKHLFAIQRKAGAYIQLFKDAAHHKQHGLVTVKLHKAK